MDSVVELSQEVEIDIPVANIRRSCVSVVEGEDRRCILAPEDGRHIHCDLVVSNGLVK